MSFRFVENKGRMLVYSLLYFVFTVIALWIDGVWFSDIFFDGRWIVNSMAIIYFALMYMSADLYLKRLMLVMVGLSFVGELIFCNVFGMYAYRGVHIPLYVPLGHSIVYASGYSLSQTDFVIRNTKSLVTFFNVLFVLLFVGVGVFFQDVFSLISGVLFFLLLKRKRWELKYPFIAICVIYIELFGTYFGCWTWVPKIFGVIPTVNPPIGAIFYYAGGDVVLAKLVEKYWNVAS